MSPEYLHLAPALAVFFLTAFIKGATGMGFATICLGVLAIFLDVREAIPLVILPSLASNVFVMADAGGFRHAVRRFWPLILAAVPGLLLGLWILGHGDGSISRGLLGLVLLVYALWSLSKGTGRLSERAERLLMVPCGLVTGLVNGRHGIAGHAHPALSALPWASPRTCSCRPSTCPSPFPRSS